MSQRRKERKKFLDAQQVPVEEALLHRADELIIQADHTGSVLALQFADEFRKLAEELHWW